MVDALELDNLTERDAEERGLELPIRILQETNRHLATLRVHMLHTFKQLTLKNLCEVNRRPTAMHKCDHVFVSYTAIFHLLMIFIR